MLNFIAQTGDKKPLEQDFATGSFASQKAIGNVWPEELYIPNLKEVTLY
jgi:hypothetical protein